ncbi:MAG: EamA family transporter [Silicimonas sp.]|nr:EamA family transporter [Silicimonas sp.]
MTAFPAALALFAAILHAVWNALVKGAGDRAVMLALISLGHVIPGVLLAMLVPAPTVEAIPFIVASTVIHWGYYVFLNLAYRFGDLSFVYPIARGAAPVLIALGALFWADEHLPVLAWVAIGTISCGIFILAAVRHADRRAIGAALVTSLLIALYSIVDGIGIRLSGSPLGYIAWLFIAEIFVVLYVALSRWPRLRATPSGTLVIGLAGGALSGLAYALVLYAKTLAPLGVISALRETSVIFAALFGILWFKERPIGRRMTAAGVVAFGIILLALS